MTNLPVVPTDATLRMTSLEVAELTGKRHDHVMRDLRKLIDSEAISLPNFGERDYTDERGKTYPMYLLDFEASMVLVTGYDALRRAAVIRRWVALERGEVAPALAGRTMTLSVADLGKLVTEISEQASRATLERLLVEYNVRKKAAAPVTEEELAAIRQALRSGLGVSETARAFGRSLSTVKKYTTEARAARRQLSLLPEAQS